MLTKQKALVLNEIGIKKGSGKAGTEVVGNAEFAQIMKVAYSKKSDLLAASIGAACKEVLGTMVSMGLTCDGLDVREVQKKIDDGEYSDQLNEFEKKNPYLN